MESEAVRTCGVCGAPIGDHPCEFCELAAHEARMLTITPGQINRVMFIGEMGETLADMLFDSCQIEQQYGTLKIWITEDK